MHDDRIAARTVALCRSLCTAGRHPKQTVEMHVLACASNDNRWYGRSRIVFVMHAASASDGAGLPARALPSVGRLVSRSRRRAAAAAAQTLCAGVWTVALHTRTWGVSTCVLDENQNRVGPCRWRSLIPRAVRYCAAVMDSMPSTMWAPSVVVGA